MIWIGVTCDFDTTTDSRGAPAPRYILGEAYTRALQNAGSQPVLLPHGPESDVGEIVEKLDGILISGGDFDVPPSYYGEEATEGLGSLQVERSGFERALIKETLRKKKPLLGICGGMQLMNVVLGGSLFQDQRYRPGSLEHQQPNPKQEPGHSVALEPDSLLYQWVNQRSLLVNSTHHQYIDTLGQNLVTSARAPDGVVEAFEIRHGQFAVGIQWHPESLEHVGHQQIYQAFVDACKGI